MLARRASVCLVHLVICLPAWSAQTARLGDQDFALESDVPALQVGGVAAVRLVYDGPPPNAGTLTWTTTAGNIVGTGENVVFQAPADRCWALVTSTGRDALGRRFEATLPIFTYRRLVMLKADDVVFSAASFRAFCDIVEHRNLRSTLGIIAESLEPGVYAPPEEQEYLDWIHEMRATGLHELYCHGYDHTGSPPGSELAYDCCTGSVSEFNCTNQGYQQTHLSACSSLALERLGFPFETFAAPFNRHDCHTLAVVDSMPELKVWLFGNAASAKVNVPKTVRAEYPMWWQVDATYFIETSYPPHADDELMAIELHPNAWDEEPGAVYHFEQFEQILDFLESEGSTFIRPIDLHGFLVDGIAPLDGLLDTDGDGLRDDAEGVTDPDADGLPSLFDLDSDGDLYLDGQEAAAGTDPQSAWSAPVDLDFVFALLGRSPDEADLNGPWSRGPVANGIPDGHELFLLTTLLADRSTSWHDQVRDAWLHNTEQLVTDAPSTVGWPVLTLAAGWLTLGDADSVRAAEEVLALWGVGIDLADYDLSQVAVLSIHGDPDGDGIDNLGEYVGAGGDEVEYVRAALVAGR